MQNQICKTLQTLGLGVALCLALASCDSPQEKEIKSKSTVEMEKVGSYSRVNRIEIPNLSKLAFKEMDERNEKEIKFKLFEDIEFEGIVRELKLIGDESYSINIEPKGDYWTSVSFFSNRGNISARLAHDDKVYVITPSDSLEKYSVKEYKMQFFENELEPEAPKLKGIDDKKLKNQLNSFDETSDHNIKISVFYTKSAALEGNIVQEISTAVSQANESTSFSDIKINFELVSTHEINYIESGDIRLDRNRLQKKGDGFLDKVHSIREQKKLISLHFGLRQVMVAE
ncbi:MAG: hypothetical protein ACFHVJ_10055 [Aestuariibacter sp.]